MPTNNSSRRNAWGLDNDVERPKISVKAGVSELKFSQELRASECLFLIILFTSWGK